MSNTAFVSLSEEKDIKDIFSKFKTVKYFDEVNANLKKSKGDLIVIVPLNDLSIFHEFKKNINLKNRIKGLLIQEELENKNIYSTLMESQKLKIFINRTIDYNSLDELKRIAWAWENESQKDLIANFEVISDEFLYVKTCSFEKLFIPVKNLISLQGLTKNELLNFEIDTHGSYIYWPAQDIHLDLENFRSAIDPSIKIKAKLRNLKMDKTYGLAIKLLRKEHNLNQTDFELSAKQIGRLESGEQKPTYNAFVSLAKAHKMSVTDYMNKLADHFQKLKAQTR